MSKSIPACQESLWRTQIPVSPCLCDECGFVPVLLPDGDRVIGVPDVEHTLLGLLGDVHGQLKGGPGVVGLPI